ncbi:MAG: hypothetical protein KAS72_04260 [Phycisphaerales bacterium]|nr:hypothetical protein [Phycisphaerales bacterium]
MPDGATSRPAASPPTVAVALTGDDLIVIRRLLEHRRGDVEDRYHTRLRDHSTEENATDLFQEFEMLNGLVGRLRAAQRKFGPTAV